MSMDQSSASAQPKTHTPGPWQANGSHFYGPDPDRRLIARLCYEGDSVDDCNQALILAAPDLLEACKHMHTLLVVMGHGCLASAILGDSAIAKAEGRV